MVRDKFLSVVATRLLSVPEGSATADSCLIGLALTGSGREPAAARNLTWPTVEKSLLIEARPREQPGLPERNHGATQPHLRARFLRNHPPAGVSARRAGETRRGAHCGDVDADTSASDPVGIVLPGASMSAGASSPARWRDAAVRNDPATW